MTRLERLMRIASTGITEDVTVNRADLRRLIKLAGRVDAGDLWNEIDVPSKPVSESGWRVIHCGVAMQAPLQRSPSGTQWQCGEHFAKGPYSAATLWAEGRGYAGAEIVAPGDLSRDEAIAQAVKEYGR